MTIHLRPPAFALCFLSLALCSTAFVASAVRQVRCNFNYKHLSFFQKIGLKFLDYIF